MSAGMRGYFQLWEGSRGWDAQILPVSLPPTLQWVPSAYAVPAWRQDCSSRPMALSCYSLAYSDLEEAATGLVIFFFFFLGLAALLVSSGGQCHCSNYDDWQLFLVKSVLSLLTANTELLKRWRRRRYAFLTIKSVCLSVNQTRGLSNLLATPLFFVVRKEAMSLCCSKTLFIIVSLDLVGLTFS